MPRCNRRVVTERSLTIEQVVPVVAVALWPVDPSRSMSWPARESGAVDRDAEQVDPGPPEADHGREQVAPPAVVLLPQEVSEEHEREGDLGERSAEDHHRVAEELDPEGHEQHVPELVDGEVDVAQERDVAELVAEGDPCEPGEHHREGQTRVALQGAR